MVCVCVWGGGGGGGCVRACVCIKARLSCLDQETQKDPHRLTNLLLVMRAVRNTVKALTPPCGLK